MVCGGNRKNALPNHCCMTAAPWLHHSCCCCTALSILLMLTGEGTGSNDMISRLTDCCNGMAAWAAAERSSMNCDEQMVSNVTPCVLPWLPAQPMQMLYCTVHLSISGNRSSTYRLWIHVGRQTAPEGECCCSWLSWLLQKLRALQQYINEPIRMIQRGVLKLLACQPPGLVSRWSLSYQGYC